jgi:hypothetical protein
MEMQQMMEILLGKMNETQEDVKTMQEKAAADRKSEREEMKHEIRAGQENLLKMMEEIMNTNQAKTAVKLEEFSEAIEETLVDREKPTSADMNSCQETTACQDAMEANLAKMDEYVAIYSLSECRNETIACQGTTEARLECEKPTPVGMESESEHREAPEM